MTTAPAIGGDEPSALTGEMKALDTEVIEVALLLPRRQALALLTAAKQRGMSAGQMLRRMIGATLGEHPPMNNS